MNNAILQLYILLNVLLFSSYRQSQINQTQSNAAVSKVIYEIRSGGKGGRFLKYIITKDSTRCIKGSSTFRTKKEITEKTDSRVWQNLINHINITDFDRIKDGTDHSAYDGANTTITIQEGKKIHSVKNGMEDQKHYDKIEPFITVLKKEMDRMNQKSIILLEKG